MGKKSTQKVLEERGMKKKSAKSRLKTADGDSEAPILVEERWKGGCKECAMKKTSTNPDWGAPMGIEE